MKKPSKLHIDRDPLLKLIAEVGKPIQRGTKRDGSPRLLKAVDLTDHIDSLRLLVEHAKGTYQDAVDEEKDRFDKKYMRKYDNNFDPDEPLLDYGMAATDEKQRRKEWAGPAHWDIM